MMNTQWTCFLEDLFECMVFHDLMLVELIKVKNRVLKWVLCLCALTAEKEFNKFQFMSIVQIEILHCFFELIINTLTCHVNDCQMIYIVFEISVEENFKWYKLLFLDELSNILHYYYLNMSLSYLYVEWSYLWYGTNLNIVCISTPTLCRIQLALDAFKHNYVCVQIKFENTLLALICTSLSCKF